MTPFQKDESVRLTARFAATLNRSPKCRIDWTKRRGVVSRCNENAALVIWHGCKSGESVPVAALEAVA